MTQFQRCIKRYESLRALYEVKESSNGYKIIVLLTEKGIYNFTFDEFENPIYENNA